MNDTKKSSIGLNHFLTKKRKKEREHEVQRFGLQQLTHSFKRDFSNFQIKEWQKMS
jgi:hypothetical protein